MDIRKLVVVLVASEIDMRMSHESALEQKGFDVIACENFNEAGPHISSADLIVVVNDNYYPFLRDGVNEVFAEGFDLPVFINRFLSKDRSRSTNGYNKPVTVFLEGPTNFARAVEWAMGKRQ